MPHTRIKERMDADDTESEGKRAKKIAKIYASRRLKKIVIRRVERHLARDICLLRAGTKHSQGELQMVRSDLEWLITWQIKDCPNQPPLWCDGVENLVISTSDGLRFQLRGEATIGPESDITHLYQCPLEGSFVLSRNLKEIKQYRLRLTDNAHFYLLRKGK